MSVEFLATSFLVKSVDGFMIGILASFFTSTGILETGLEVDDNDGLSSVLVTSLSDKSFLSVI